MYKFNTHYSQPASDAKRLERLVREAGTTVQMTRWAAAGGQHCHVTADDSAHIFAVMDAAGISPDKYVVIDATVLMTTEELDAMIMHGVKPEPRHVVAHP